MDLLIGIPAWLIASVVVGAVAASRGRSGFGFFLISFLLSPLIGLLVLLLVRNYAEEDRQWRARQDATRGASPLQPPAVTTTATGGGSTRTPDATGMELRISQLERLAALRSAGVLSDTEFEEQKRQLLGGEAAADASSAVATVATASAQDAPLFGLCPTCRSTIQMDATVCPSCGASKAARPDWEPRPL